MDISSVLLLILITVCLTVISLYVIKASIQMTIDKCFELKLQQKAVEKFDENVKFDANAPMTQFIPYKDNDPVSPPSFEQGAVKQECPNKSLNELHKVGKDLPKPNIVACGNQQTTDDEDESKFYREVYRPYRVPIDKNIIPSNYYQFETNPNPYKLDYPLFDKNAPVNDPVGVNSSLSGASI
jgi:hypothetical protein